MKKRSFMIGIIMAISLLCSCGSPKLPTITEYNSAKCNNGTFIGDEKEDIVVWRGIPYATQPVGKLLRWKKALPAEDNNGTFAAVKPGHMPVGTNDDTNGAVQFGEDCLVLNVFNSKKSTIKNKPVMVWIHGGGFVSESISSPLYDLSHIANQYPDVIFVTIEYREGFLGFMNFEKVEGGENYKDATNLGLLDQLEALKWINKNISAFGGDPNRVTLFGESAGSASISFLPLIEGSEGLFNRVIIQSSGLAYCDTMEHGLHVTENFLHVTGCKNMDELLNLSLNDLLKATQEGTAIDSKNMLGAANFPLLDGRILPEDRADMYKMWETEKLANIDLLIGSNRDEAKYFLPFEESAEKFTEALKWAARKDRTMLNDEEKVMFDAFMDTLSGETELEKYQQYSNDINFRACNTNMAIRHSNAGGKTFMYFLEKPGVNDELGVIHGTEMMYLFDNPFDHLNYHFFPRECELKYQIKEMWVNFAKTGNPSTSEHEWLPFSKDNRQTMVFSDTIGMKKDIFNRREDLMMSWAERLGNGASKRFC